MKTSLIALAITAVPCLVPLTVYTLSRQHSESPFGNAFEMMAVMAMGLSLAIGYAIVAALKIRARREGASVWILGTGIALSPILYFIIWNTFFRSS